MSRYSEYYICKETISLVQHPNPVWLSIYKSVIYKLRQLLKMLWYSNENRAIYNPQKKIPSYVSLQKHMINIQWKNISIYWRPHYCHTFTAFHVNRLIWQKNQAIFTWSDKMFTQYDQIYEKQHEEWNKKTNKFSWKIFGNEMVNTTSNILRLSEDNKGLK